MTFRFRHRICGGDPLLPMRDELLMPPTAPSRGWWGAPATCSPRVIGAKSRWFHFLPFLPCHTREFNRGTATFNPGPCYAKYQPCKRPSDSIHPGSRVSTGGKAFSCPVHVSSVFATNSACASPLGFITAMPRSYKLRCQVFCRFLPGNLPLSGWAQPSPTTAASRALTAAPGSSWALPARPSTVKRCPQRCSG